MSGHLVGINESEMQVCITNGLSYKAYRVFETDKAFEGVALTMEGPDDPITLWTTDAMQTGNDSWKHLEEPEEIMDIRKITKRDGDPAAGVLIQTTKRRVAFGTKNKSRQLTAEEKAEYAEALAQVAADVKAAGGKVKKMEGPKKIEDPEFFWEVDGTGLNDYGDPQPDRRREELATAPDGFAIEHPFLSQDIDSFVHNARKYLNLV